MSKKTQGPAAIAGVIAGGVGFVAFVALMVLGGYAISPAVFIALLAAIAVAVLLYIATQKRKPEPPVTERQGANDLPVGARPGDDRVAEGSATREAPEVTLSGDPSPGPSDPPSLDPAGTQETDMPDASVAHTPPAVSAPATLGEGTDGDRPGGTSNTPSDIPRPEPYLDVDPSVASAGGAANEREASASDEMATRPSEAGDEAPAPPSAGSSVPPGGEREEDRRAGASVVPPDPDHAEPELGSPVDPSSEMSQGSGAEATSRDATAPNDAIDVPAERMTGDAAAPAAAPKWWSSQLVGEAELASRKGSWRYEPGPVADARAEETGPAEAGRARDQDAGETVDIGTEPRRLHEPRDGRPDDLKKIKGVGPKLEKMLNTMGFYHFDQVAGWTDQEVAWVDENLRGFRGRVSRDKWVSQATILAEGGETEFSRRVGNGGPR